MSSYRHIEHTADLGFEICASSVSELFETAAFALFETITNVDDVISDKILDVDLTAQNQEDLFFLWMRELLYLHNVKKYVLSDFKISDLQEHSLSAHVSGEVYKEGKHMLKSEIKAVTYHDLSVKRIHWKWLATVVFDV